MKSEWCMDRKNSAGPLLKGDQFQIIANNSCYTLVYSPLWATWDLHHQLQAMEYASGDVSIM